MGRNWAITIGINGYRNLNLLQYAKQDAEAMQFFLQEELHIQNVYHFTDDSPAIPQDYGPPLDSLPTYATLQRFFRIRFEEPFLKPGDNLWFFFAGHGKRYEERDYLMPIDADPGDESGKSTWIPLSHITERLRRSGADNVVMLIDACRNEGRRDSSGFGQEKQRGVITLFACSPWESSYEIEELQHGAFTYALLQGLQLEGEGNCATVERLYQRLQRTVPQLTQQYKRVQQTPYGVIEPPTKYHLILLPWKANPTDITTLKLDAQRAELGQDFKLAKQLWTRVLAASLADHDAIEGIERLALASAISATPLAETRMLIPSAPTGTHDATPSTPTKLALSTFQFDLIKVNAQGQQVNHCSSVAQYQIEELGNGTQLKMVSIPGGQFQMGSPQGEGDDDERPQHTVTVKPFLISKYPITQSQWKVVAALPKVNHELNPDPSQFKGANHPIEQVSWTDVIEFCARLSRKTGHEYRLPNEAEWEYACRAETETPFHFGETITSGLANYNGRECYAYEDQGIYRQKTTPIDSFNFPNSFGLYEMHGNVWEWCADPWHANYKEAPIYGTSWTTNSEQDYRVMRGGSWNSPPNFCRSAYRMKGRLAQRGDGIGFRVARSI